MPLPGVPCNGHAHVAQQTTGAPPIISNQRRHSPRAGSLALYWVVPGRSGAEPASKEALAPGSHFPSQSGTIITPWRKSTVRGARIKGETLLRVTPQSCYAQAFVPFSSAETARPTGRMQMSRRGQPRVCTPYLLVEGMR